MTTVNIKETGLGYNLQRFSNYSGLFGREPNHYFTGTSALEPFVFSRTFAELIPTRSQ